MKIKVRPGERGEFFISDESIVEVDGKQIYPVPEPKPPIVPMYGVGSWFRIDSNNVVLCLIEGRGYLLSKSGSRWSASSLMALDPFRFTLEQLRGVFGGDLSPLPVPNGITPRP